MATPLPARDIFDGTALPVTSAMKTAMGSLRDYLAEQLGTTGGAPTAITSINGGQLAGNRRKSINGDFSVNQLNLTSPVTLAAGVYGHDGWKAGAGGCTYSFATVANVTTVTITAGTLVQILDGKRLTSGNHILSWAGTAQGRWGGAGAYSASGVIGTTTGGVNAQIEFGTGTLSFVQAELGAVATTYELTSDELGICQQYYEQGLISDSGGLGNCFNSLAFTVSLLLGFRFKVVKQALPAVALYSRNGTVNKVSLVASGADAGTSVTASSISKNGCNNLIDSGAGLTQWSAYEVFYTASARL